MRTWRWTEAGSPATALRRPAPEACEAAAAAAAGRTRNSVALLATLRMDTSALYVPAAVALK